MLSRPMRIMSLNAWGGKLAEELLAFLAATPPDVLCLQEVTETPEAPRGNLTYRDGDHMLPQHANLFRAIRDALPEHVATFCPAACGDLWDGDVSVRSWWGIATYVHRRFAMVGQVQGFVHKDYSADGYGEHPRSRCAHGVRLYDEARHGFVTITHMDGLRDKRGKMDTPERARQATRFLDMARHLTQVGDTAVVCGDFNVEPASETLRLLATAGFVELVTAGGFAGTRTTHYRKPATFADYMLVSDPLAVRDFAVVRQPEVSDHCPLLLTI